MTDHEYEFFSDGEPEGEEITLQEQIANLWFMIHIFCHLQQKLPLEDIFGCEVKLEAISGSKTVHLKGGMQFGEMVQNVDLQIPIDKKLLMCDNEGDYLCLNWGMNEIGSKPQCFFWWFEVMSLVYKRGKPPVKVEFDLFTFSRN
jgi:hypothetical protein